MAIIKKILQGVLGLKKDPNVATQDTAVIRAEDTNSGIAIVPNGTGVITATTAGDARGNYSIDLQRQRTNSNQVASGLNGVLIGGRYNRIAGDIGVVVGGQDNEITGGGFNSILGGRENSIQTISTGYSVIGGGNSNTINVAGAGSSTISGGQNNTASTGTHATVVGGRSNTSSGTYSTSGGFDNLASGLSSTSFGSTNTSSGNYSVTMGRGNQASNASAIALGRDNVASGIRAVALGQSNTASGQRSAAFNLNTLAQADNSTAFGIRGVSYLNSQVSFCADTFGFAQTGNAQQSYLTARKEDTLTTGATTVLSLDGTGTTHLIIPDGNNRAWNTTVKYTAVVTAISGTATGVTVGDAIYGTSEFGFKKLSGTSSITSLMRDSIVADTAIMETAELSYSVGASEELALTFTAPTFAGGGDVTMRVVAKVELVELGF